MRWYSTLGRPTSQLLPETARQMDGKGAGMQKKSQEAYSHKEPNTKQRTQMNIEDLDKNVMNQFRTQTRKLSKWMIESVTEKKI